MWLLLFLSFLHISKNAFSRELNRARALNVEDEKAVHRFTSFQSAALLFLFLLVSIALLHSETTTILPLLPDLFSAFGSALFFLQYSVSFSTASVHISDLQAKCDSVCFPLLDSRLPARLFIADVGLAAAICLQGLWVFWTGLSLYVEAFIPEDCRCLMRRDPEESRLSAVAISDLVFVFMIRIRGLASYEALRTIASDSNHIQMKALTGMLETFDGLPLDVGLSM
ncbi:uncharacterized protein LOC110639844 [Hevea brasiliensis]|uniref:uncharacterized protein LOC110639844 n=1 Tax=Hevea brasiliensis TaxID=3981 RepID=UPI0025FCD3FB|nr:uncharacterized protein LOC110639844 [Hevea brasiliensis]